MKKIIAIVVLLVVVAGGVWVAATYWVGVQAEQQYRSLLQRASEVQYLKFTNKSYERGLLSAKAQTVMELQLPAADKVADQPLQITLAHDITHGPFPLGKAADGSMQFKPVMAIIETRLVLGAEAKDLLAEFSKQVPQLASARDYTVLQLDGSLEEHLLIPAFQNSFGTEDKVAVDWKGLTLQLNLTRDLKGFSGTLSVPGLDVTAKDGVLKLKTLKSACKFSEGIGGLSLGDASFDVASLEFVGNQAPDSHNFAVRSFNITASNQAAGDNVNCLVAIGTEQVKLDELQYGPGAFELELRNLDAASLGKLQQALRDLQLQAPQQTADELQAAMLAKYTEVLPTMLKKSPELEIRRLDLKTPDGDFTGKAKVAIDGSKGASLDNLLMLATAISAQAELKVAEGLVHRVAANVMKDSIIADSKDQEGEPPTKEELDAIAAATVDAQLKTLMDQNLIVKDNGNYAASASYRAGQIVLNGHPLSLQNLLQ